ncbi:hypothetical protein CBR_g8385 [Chara braunii]|uniref:Reverse transcriptase domain-containing protein n=1 Tax=Chara braunii TaxID=69332 RepID=A0A388KM14_CHABU|nr:hypothetical protein CBR_g8385 [Chara braunii]|eukprot:GBG71085.1 hypothetical protein CBR_g8385 [Chara braunii]
MDGCVRLKRVLAQAEVPQAQKKFGRIDESLAPRIVKILRGFLPGTVTRRLQPGLLTGSGMLSEIRRCTCLFVGLLSLTSHQPPGQEQLTRVQLTMTTVQKCLEAFEGCLIQFRMDEKGYLMIAAFGLPGNTHEDDTMRGIQAAMMIKDSLSAVRQKCAIGVTTGKLLCVTVGGKRRCEYTVYGDPINLSARLMKKAGEDILTDPATYRDTSDGIEYLVLAPIKLKGKSSVLEVFRPLGEKKADGTVVRPQATSGSHTHGSRSSFTSTKSEKKTAHPRVMVGREKELVLLQSKATALVKSWKEEAAANGLAQEGHKSNDNENNSIPAEVVAVVGQIGIGKGKLIDVLRERLKSQPDLQVIVVNGGYLGGTQAQLFGPWVRLALEFLPADKSAEQRGEMVAELVGEEHRAHLWMLNNILNIHVPEPTQFAWTRSAIRTPEIRNSQAGVRTPLNAIVESSSRLAGATPLYGKHAHKLPLSTSAPITPLLARTPRILSAAVENRHALARLRSPVYESTTSASDSADTVAASVSSLEKQSVAAPDASSPNTSDRLEALEMDVGSLKDDVQLQQTATQQLEQRICTAANNSSSEPRETAPKFDGKEIFCDSTKTDPIPWFRKFELTSQLHYVKEHKHQAYLYSRSGGACQAWLDNLLSKYGVVAADLPTKINWDDLKAAWHKRFQVKPPEIKAMDKLMVFEQGTLPSVDWIAEYQRLTSVPDIQMGFKAIRHYFISRSCLTLSNALTHVEDTLTTTAELFDKAAHIIITNNEAKNLCWSAAGPSRDQHRPKVDVVEATMPFDQTSEAVSANEGDRLAAAREEVTAKLFWATCAYDQPEEIGLRFLRTVAVADSPPTDLSSNPRVVRLLYEFADIFESHTGVVPDQPISHEIILKAGAVPLKGCIYRMSEEELEVLRTQLDDLLAKGWIHPSNSPYGAPVLFVRKKNKDLRLCTDYRKLNAQTVKNAGPLPRIEDLLERLGGAKYFSKLDLKSGYHQISIRPNDRYKSTFKTRYGHFEWVVMPFGLTNAPTTFQAAMTNEFRAVLDRFVLVYLDDILVYRRSLGDHLEHLRRVLETLRRAKYKAYRDKCEFVRQELKYLGHFVTPEGISLLSDKIQAIQEWPEPRNVTDVCSFLGLAGYYQRFIKGYSKIAAHLTKLQCEDGPFDFGEKARESFLTLKAALLSAEVLHIYDPLLPTRVTTNASGYGIGAVLEQHDGVDWHPVEYFSKKVSVVHSIDDARKKELLAFVHVLKQWRHFLLGRSQFRWVTDNNPLVFYKTQDTVNSTIARWMTFIDQFDFFPNHIPGKSNRFADALSRRPDHCTAVYSTFEIDHDLRDSFIRGYQADPEFSDKYANCSSPDYANCSSPNPAPSHYWIQEGYLLVHTRGKDLLCVSTGPHLRTRLLDEFHDAPATGHFGVDRTIGRLREELDLEATKELISETICGQADAVGIPDTLYKSIYDKTQGHPLFVEQMASTLTDKGIIEVVNGGICRVKSQLNLSQLSFSHSVEAVITSRVDLLKPLLTLILKVASVIGSTFHTELLLSVLNVQLQRRTMASVTKEQLDAALLELDKLNMVSHRETDPEGMYTFSNSVTQRVAYDMLPFKTRRLIHMDVAQSLAAKGASAMFVSIAYHFTMACKDVEDVEDDLAENAIFYWEAAADDALFKFGEYNMAITYYKEALNLGKVASLQIPRQRVAGWHRHIAYSYGALGELAISRDHTMLALQQMGVFLKPDWVLQCVADIVNSEAVKWFCAIGCRRSLLMEALERLRQRTRWTHNLHGCVHWCGKPANAREEIQQGQDHDKQDISHALYFLVVIALRKGDLPYAQAAARKYLMVVQSIRRPAIGEMARAFAANAACAPERWTAEVYVNLCLDKLEDESETYGSLCPLADAHYILAWVFQFNAKWDLMEDHLYQAFSMYKALQMPSEVDKCDCVRAMGFLFQGQEEDCRQIASKLISVQKNHPELRVWGLCLLMAAANAAGQYAETIAMYREWEREAHTVPELEWELPAIWAEAEWHVGTQDRAVEVALGVIPHLLGSLPTLPIYMLSVSSVVEVLLKECEKEMLTEKEQEERKVRKSELRGCKRKLKLVKKLLQHLNRISTRIVLATGYHRFFQARLQLVQGNYAEAHNLFLWSKRSTAELNMMMLYNTSETWRAKSLRPL